MSVRIIRKNPGWLEKLVTSYDNRSVLAIGWPRSTDAVGKAYPDGTPVVLVAAVNNFGSASRGIPARPFMSESAEPAVIATEPIAGVMIRKVNEGKATVEDALREMGPYAAAAFQTTITDHAWIPNSPRTVEEKQSDKPLIDTADMRNSLTWIVRRADA